MPSRMSWITTVPQRTAAGGGADQCSDHAAHGHKAHDAADIHELLHEVAALELAQVLVATLVADLGGKPRDRHGRHDGDEHGQDRAHDGALLSQLDAQTKGDDADGALEEGVTNTGKRTHEGGLDRVDRIGVEVLRIVAYSSSMEAARPRMKALVCGVQL